MSRSALDVPLRCSSLVGSSVYVLDCFREARLAVAIFA